MEACTNGLRCVVPVGPSQRLLFEEHAVGGAVANYDGHHIACYTSRLDEVYATLQRLKLIWNNPRFVKLGLRYDTLEMSLAVNEVRFLDIADPAEGVAEVLKLRAILHNAGCHRLCLWVWKRRP